LNSLRFLTSLVLLDLKENRLTHKSLVGILQSLPMNIHTVDLSMNDMRNASEAVGQYLSESSALTELRLSKCSLTTVDLRFLSHGLCATKSLLELSIGSNAIRFVGEYCSIDFHNWCSQ
jgi:Ran GTPase-activating protein (RanGAP) involved in mRNA processing and transport